jgi:hypothetical protein
MHLVLYAWAVIIDIYILCRHIFHITANALGKFAIENAYSGTKSFFFQKFRQLNKLRRQLIVILTDNV